ncbi:hypothetical protein C8R45DRAFT_1163058 [Mycena sanguinolenta]|nr:hypothetical protein C8R45DRAFT_1163058 [Mycena sanguinolenta]
MSAQYALPHIQRGWQLLATTVFSCALKIQWQISGYQPSWRFRDECEFDLIYAEISPPPPSLMSSLSTYHHVARTELESVVSGPANLYPSYPGVDNPRARADDDAAGFVRICSMESCFAALPRPSQFPPAHICAGSTLTLAVGMFFSIAINLPWDDVNETCWYRSRDPSAMLRWLVGTQTVWILLASLGEVIAFMVIFGYMVLYRLVPEDTPTSSPSTASHRPGPTILRFQNIIMRIGLYPLASCILNISTTVIEFYLFQTHQNNVEAAQQRNWRLDLADLAIYAGRPLIYGLLATTDPSFIRALRALRHPQNESETLSHVGTSGLVMSTIIYLPQDDISFSEHKDDTLGSRTEAQMGGHETSTIPIPDQNLEMALPPVVDGNGMPTSIEVVCHI